jgi:GTP cyclohydrolase IA
MENLAMQVETNLREVDDILPRPVPQSDDDELLASASMDSLVRELLIRLNEDPDREGLIDTPKRVTKSLKFLTSGYDQDPAQLIQRAVFTDKYDEMVIVKDISIFSMCEHHLLPFHGIAHVAYLPDGRLVGLSKIARMVELFARRFQIQERLTQQIAETLQKILQAKGVAVVIEAQHLCMQMRGVLKEEAKMITSAMLGHFRTNQATRDEFMNLISS